MIRKRLGRTNLEVTQLGYGSMGLRGPRTWGVRVIREEGADRFFNAVLDAGINFVDTSPDYGVSEERIGRYISSRRDEFYLATKCGCAYTKHEDHIEINHLWQRDVIQRNIETSVENLSASRSRIQDADFAAETAALTRSQILQQAGVSILAQANQAFDEGGGLVNPDLAKMLENMVADYCSAAAALKNR